MEETSNQISTRVIEDEMKQSYLAYSMSVIVGRALPDVKDGLKPVHRRILYAMHDMGMFHNKPFKKSARIVGEVLGKYHPHGDTAVYDSMVRMAQTFSLRYPLINGQGNFGSVDGDSAAAMRYTEAKLNKLAEELLKDIEKETIPFVPNFDGSLQEPAYLPCKVPNLLINGSSGIAVGMATNIPPHNLTEIANALIHLIKNPNAEVLDLLEFVKGPDFPTGGIILGTAGVRSAFTRGRGRVVVKAKTHVEDHNNRQRIIVTEIPYMVNKSSLLEQIADNVRDKRVEGISDLRDESDREGMRIVIELKQHAQPDVVLNQLLKHTRLQDAFNVIMLCLVDKEPKVLDLKGMLYHFLEHRKDVIKKRTAYDLKVAKEREHIVHGLIIALDNIDEVVKKIKASKSGSEALETLKSSYGLSDLQAKAILDMRLQKLSSLEQQKLRDELLELRDKITHLQGILESAQKILDIIIAELEELITLYGDARQTAIEEGGDLDIEDEDLIQEDTMVITLTHAGYVKRVPLSTYKAQGRGGKGIIAATTKEEDFVEELFIASTHDYLLAFTDKGKVYWKKVYQLPEASRTAKGIPIVNVIRSEQGEKVTTIIPIRKFTEGNFLFFGTRKGIVKRVTLESFSNPRQGGIKAINLDNGDELINVLLTDGKQQILLATTQGMAVKFDENDVRVMGRTAYGVRGIRLRNGVVSSMVLAKEENTILTITKNGYGKRTPVSDYRLINRGGSGVINIKCTEKNGPVVAVRQIEGDEDVLMISRRGIAIRVSTNNISVIGRNTQGVRVMRLNESDEVVALSKCPPDVDEESASKQVQPIPPSSTSQVVNEIDLEEESQDDVNDSEDEDEPIDEEDNKDSDDTQDDDSGSKYV